MLRAPALVLAALAAGCSVHLDPPPAPPTDATGGHAPRGFDSARACNDWDDSVGPGGSAATSHISFPELDPRTSCFVPVRYHDGGDPHPDPIPDGCGYPRHDLLAGTVATLDRRAERYEKIASDAAQPFPLDLACSLPDDVRRAAARSNAKTLRALAERLAGHAPFPYAVVGTFGYGFGAQGKSALVSFRPGDACPPLPDSESETFSVNFVRASRAADAYKAGVAPVVTVSGGAVHSRLTEAFLLDYLLTCRFGVPADAVLVDPCADHTHTNIRNTGSLVAAIGGRTAYLITDDFLQARYLEEFTAFDFIFGSVDQRSLRDFGYLLGAFRRASVGLKSGFWYTPYRFWAEPANGLGSFTCIP
jgi:hypothetical protein